MPRTEITVATISRAGTDEQTQQDSDFTNGMYVAKNNGRIFFRIENTDMASQTVAVEFGPGAEVDEETPDDKTITIGSGDIVYFGPFPIEFYNQTDDDDALYVNPSIDVNLKFEAYRLGA